MLNKIIIMGRMTKDAELRQTNGGVSVTSFTLAVDRDYKPQDGDRQVDFIDVTAWRNTAEFAAKYLGRGRMAIVSGSLQINEWTDKEGHKRRNAVVVAENIYFGDSKKSDAMHSDSFAPSGFGTTGVGFAEIDDDDSTLPV